MVLPTFFNSGGIGGVLLSLPHVQAKRQGDGGQDKTTITDKTTTIIVLKVETYFQARLSILRLHYRKTPWRYCGYCCLNWSVLFLYHCQVFYLNDTIADAAVKVKGGANLRYVDHGLVISIPWEIVTLFVGLIHVLKLIVMVELLGEVACTLKELAVVVADLFIVCIFFFLISLTFTEELRHVSLSQR